MLAATLLLLSVTSGASPELPLRIVDSYEDMRGMMEDWSENEKVQIIDFAFGIGQDNALCTAYLRGIAPNGAIRVTDQRSFCKVVFNNVSDVKGFQMYLGQTLCWVEDITFGARLDGRVSVLAYDVIDPSGTRHRKHLDPIALVMVKCDWQVNKRCTGAGTCTGTCPDLGSLAPCPCSGGTGTCQSTWLATCPPKGVCTPPETCQETGLNCDCD